MERQISVPRWVLAYMWLTLIMVITFSILGYVKPDALFGTWRAFGADGALDLVGPRGFYLARNVATVLVIAFALISRKRDMIFLALLLRGFTDLVDFIHLGPASGAWGPAVPALVMTLAAAGGITHMRRQRYR